VITLRAVTLADELLHGMVLAKVELCAAVLLVVGLVASSAGVLTYRTLDAQPAEEQQAPRSTATASRLDPPKPEAAQPARDEPRTRIVGVVVDEAGRPVAGAQVKVTWSRKAPEAIQTAADGSFSLGIGSPTRRSEVVHATADGGTRQGLARFEQAFARRPCPSGSS
jgi:hypothetical protein